MKPRNRLIALLLTLALLFGLAPASLAAGEAFKISPELAEEMANKPDTATFPVWIWLHDLTTQELEQLILDRCGTTEPEISQLRQVLRDYYTGENQSFLTQYAPDLPPEDHLFVSHYGPILILRLTKARILSLELAPEVTEVALFVSYDLVPETIVVPTSPTPVPEPTSPEPMPEPPTPSETLVPARELPGPVALEIRQAYRLLYAPGSSLQNVRVVGYYGQSQQGYELVTLRVLGRDEVALPSMSWILLASHLFYFHDYTEQIPVLAYRDDIFLPLREGFAQGALTQADVDSVYQQMYPWGTYVSKPFQDVARNAWYYPFVHDAATAGITAGVSESGFAPQGTLTRAMFVTMLRRVDAPETHFLVREAVHPAARVSAPQAAFQGVPPSAHSAGPALWASAIGVSMGVDADRFAPNDPITRQQAVTMLWRYVDALGICLSETGSDREYADRDQIAPYAVEAVAWARRTGLMSGDDANRFRPKDEITRAEAAKIMWMLYAALYEGRFTRTEQYG